MNITLFKIYEYIKFKKMGLRRNPNIMLKELLKSQYWPESKLKTFQLEKMNQLLSFAKEELPFYKINCTKLNLPINDFREIKSKLKVIEKIDIVNNYKSFKTTKFTTRFLTSTSGTTGTPLTIHKSSMTKAYSLALHKRFHSWWGININDRNLYIARHKKHKNKSIIRLFKEYLRGRLDIDIFDLNENSIYQYVQKIENFKPTYIRGYKSGVLELAKLMNESNLRFSQLKLKVAIVTSEVLYENERKFIEKILGCNVANEYGSVEAGLYAVECPKGSLHINEEAIYMYTNENNEAIVTELDNYSIPLINYKNEDIVFISQKKCKCGRNLKVIDKVEGRTSDYIIKSDGAKVNKIFINVLFLELNRLGKENPVKKFQIIQKSNLFTIRIVSSRTFDDTCKEYLKKRFFEVIGEDIQIKFDLTQNIEREKSGKFKMFVKEL